MPLDISSLTSTSSRCNSWHGGGGSISRWQVPSQVRLTTRKAQKFLADRQAQGRVLLYHLLEEHSWDRPNNLFLEYEGRSWTYKQFFDNVQRVGNWLLNDLGIQNGEMVALDGPNSAEYLLIWFALASSPGYSPFVKHAVMFDVI